MEVDLRFVLKDVCALTGVSHQSIRTYEKMGVLPKLTEEGNGYRYYHYPDLQRAVFLRYYADLGIPIKETAKLISGADARRLLKVHEQRIEALNRRIALEKAAIDCLTWQKERLAELESCVEECRIETSPGIYQLCCSSGGKLERTRESVRLLKEWAELRPITFFSGVAHPDEQGPDGVVNPAYAIFDQHSYLLSELNSRYIHYYPPVLSVRSVLRVSSKAKDFFSMGVIVQQFMQEHHLKACGDNISISIANKTLTSAFPDDPSDYICVWTPIEQKNS